MKHPIAVSRHSNSVYTGHRNVRLVRIEGLRRGGRRNPDGGCRTAIWRRHLLLAPACWQLSWGAVAGNRQLSGGGAPDGSAQDLRFRFNAAGVDTPTGSAIRNPPRASRCFRAPARALLSTKTHVWPADRPYYRLRHAAVISRHLPSPSLRSRRLRRLQGPSRVLRIAAISASLRKSLPAVPCRCGRCARRVHPWLPLLSP